MLRFAAWFVFAAAIAWLLKRIFASDGQRQVSAAKERTRVEQAARTKQLYRDPMCGSYIAEEISYPWEHGSETLHFCSRECMEHYRAGARLAAGA